MLKNLIPVVCSFLVLAGCQTAPPLIEPAPEQETSITALPPEPEKTTQTAELPPPADLWERIRRELHWQRINNEQVGRARVNYLRQRDYLSVISERAALYLYYIVDEVERRGLPVELALLPIVESTLNPRAESPEQAMGLWQIMPRTGKQLGLTNNWWYDGRRDVRDSTHAALDYLEQLHKTFDGDWLLALAAYNSGPARVKRAQRYNLKEGRSTDYWSLQLPRETREYVPRVVALASLIAYPEAFGVEFSFVPNYPAFEVVATGGQIELVKASEMAGLELRQLRDLNPGHLRWATSPDVAQELLLPLGSDPSFSSQIAALGAEDRVSWQYYRIERGDSLGVIAQKFNTEVGLLREANSLKGSRIRAGDTLMIPKGRGWAASLALAEPGSRKARGYSVRNGDSLYIIAGRFKVTINEIISWNDLDPNKYLQPGQKLTLYVDGG